LFTDDNSPVKVLAEGKLRQEDIKINDFSQCIAAVTTFAFIQEIRHPGKREMYPILMISRCGVVMIVYSPSTDILLATPTLKWESDLSFFVIWLSLHYHLFTIKIPDKKAECGFKEIFEKYVTKKKYIYLQPSFNKRSKPKKTHLVFVPFSSDKEVYH
jgi:hypothetical protein